jgi:hypothetical protein
MLYLLVQRTMNETLKPRSTIRILKVLTREIPIREKILMREYL